MGRQFRWLFSVGSDRGGCPVTGDGYDARQYGSHLVDRYLHQAGERADPSLRGGIERRGHPDLPHRVARPATTTLTRDSD